MTDNGRRDTREGLQRLPDPVCTTCWLQHPEGACDRD